jgi:hypothetical protein
MVPEMGFGQSRASRICAGCEREFDVGMAQSAMPQDNTHADAPKALPERLSARRSRRNWPARLAIAAGSAVMMGFIAVFALFLALSSGPIAVPFIKERVADALEARLGAGFDVQVGEAKLEKTANGLEVHIFDVTFRDAVGKEILRSPEAVVSFDPLQLAAFRLSPRRLALQGMTVKAEVRPDGEIRLMTSDQTGATAQAARLDEAMGFMAAVAQTGTLSGLSEVSIADARLVIDDQRVGREIAFERMAAVFETRSPGRPALSGSVTRAGATFPFRLEAVAEGDGARFDLSMSQLPLRLVETLGGLAALPLSGGVTASMKASLIVSADGKAQSGSAAAWLTPGKLRTPTISDTPLGIEEAKLEAVWTGNPDRIDQVSLRFAGDGGKGVLTGVLHLPDGNEGDYRFDGRLDGMTLAPLAPSDKPVTVSEGRLQARIGVGWDRIVIDSLTLDGPETALKLSGKVAKQDDGATVAISLQAGRMPLRTALRWWPAGVAPEGRAYLTGALLEGTLNALTVTLNLNPAGVRALLAEKPIPPESLRLDFSADAATMRVLDGLPNITGLSAAGWLNAAEAQVTASRGQIDLRTQDPRAPARRIQLSEGGVQLQGLDQPMPEIAIAFRAQSAVEHAAEFLTLAPLKDVFSLKVSAQDVRGQFDGKARLSFPLKAELKAQDVRTEANATLKGVSIEKAIGRDRLENANLTISADRTGLELKGEGRWQGMPVSISLENDAADKSSATVLSFTLDDAAQKRFGVDGQVRGPLPVKVKTQREDGGGLKAQVEVDLSRASLDGLIPGLQKPAGRPGKLTFDAAERPRGYALQNIALDSGSASFRGQAEIGQDGTVNSTRFSLFRLSPGDNVRLDFDRTGSGGKVTIRGNNFDARPFLRQAMQDATPTVRGERDIDLELKTTLLSGHGGEVLTNADVKMQRRNGQVRQLAVTGRINGKSVSIGGQASDRPATLAIDADDAGGLLRYLDIYSRMSGGDLQGQVRPSPRDVSGFFIARNFSLRNEPALGRLLSEGAPDRAPRAAESAAFTKMRLDFSRTGSVTTVKDAVIFGPQIGLTFNGIVDLVRDRVSLSGTFVPAYGLNNAFAQIPVVGTILGGGRNEGLLAVTFGVSGRASQPTVNINPLSAVTPGIFRKIFEFRNDRTGAAAPDNAPPVAPN